MPGELGHAVEAEPAQPTIDRAAVAGSGAPAARQRNAPDSRADVEPLGLRGGKGVEQRLDPLPLVPVAVEPDDEPAAAGARGRRTVRGWRRPDRVRQGSRRGAARGGTWGAPP